MDIMEPRTVRWVAPTTRTDGAPVTGTLSYIVEIVGSAGTDTYNSDVTQMRIDWFTEGYAPGDYQAYVRSVETTGAAGRVSDRSVGFPFTLEQIANPNPPTSVEVV